ncbi:Predicted DNA-binding protein, contains Ribbon-helix-helix (RHH) domain [Arboricoccus pini]|uniref:Predicted DNA-binding protein, contains Ribbon-helix-helix (RHH) domain n=1 Tax=Arboricoccus pini TaxID=1963835 RepID=A0A212RTF5_9PROT|nr:ribbon-helix-helix domain-containing protein [Arboricoccus pini]SNB75921.1 Predicted DNA-binding protein, contains Ribbon-helix-helix (RHH) domain [Arboricoccus pini]
MIRKTMRIGELRTSIKLEAGFWDHLKEIADSRKLRLSALINHIAQADPERTNLASTLRQYSLNLARAQIQDLQKSVQELSLSGGSDDLLRIIDMSPMPCLLLDRDRVVRQMNKAFTSWLNLDASATIGKRLDNIMILRGSTVREMWACLMDGRLTRASFNGTYVSPGKVRTAQAVAIGLGIGDRHGKHGGGYAVMFETTANTRL